MEITPIITIEGTYSGEYYCPAEQVKYIDEETFMNVSSDDIILYDTDSIDYILLKPFQNPMHYDGADLVVISDFGDVQYNNIAQYYHDLPYAVPICIYVILCVTLAKIFTH